MEWLEFAHWSPAVRQQLAEQAARLSVVVHDNAPPAARCSQDWGEQLQFLLRQAPATNPWGHPAAEA
ncbi:hypothetical protein [Melittangium boletus]|uniref:Uncharacterized protein n=1 Tax=Melittangium boletus DSM 14713 TaxID=1294270 RepID=A0A250IID8_9BACT|nr:hypothetical protein [Melittangium boletus]ATB31584.1 hypothetical protein MEBOL_005047 [Melittangium boletus DSM 14713]